VLVEGTLSTGIHEQAFQKVKCLHYFLIFYHDNSWVSWQFFKKSKRASSFSLGDSFEQGHSQNDGHLCIVGL
jgi:hypothetical protein